MLALRLYSFSAAVKTMDCRKRNALKTSLGLVIALAFSLIASETTWGQIRTKRPDRGTYKPPTMQGNSPKKPARSAKAVRSGKLAPVVRDFNLTRAPSPIQRDGVRNSEQLVETELEEATRQARVQIPRKGQTRQIEKSRVRVASRQQKNLSIPTPPPEEAFPAGRGNPKRLMFNNGVVVTGETILAEPLPPETVHAPTIQAVPTAEPPIAETPIPHPVEMQDPVETPIPHPPVSQGEIVNEGDVVYDEGYYQEPVMMDEFPVGSCDGCDSCGVTACDAMGGCGPCARLPKANGFISFSPDNWFGSVELMMMWRNGDRLPALVTTGPDDDATGGETPEERAGRLDVPLTAVLVGDTRQYTDLTGGGRLQIGTWLDSAQQRSLVLRGWFAGEEEFGFSANQGNFPVIARPFFNVTDGEVPAQDTQLIAFPNRVDGTVSVSGDSNVYGGDLSIRQFWYGQSDIVVDLLYGYQYMRFDESLSIQSTSVSLDDDFAPIGAVISVDDAFNIENEFHGGQLGLASRCRYGCWSFDSLAKLGFGSLARRANLRGTTTTSVDAATAVDPNGLLVRNTNDGSTTDHTFAWVPELDFTLAYHRFPNYEVTFGYHIIALTESLRVSDAIDRDLAVNLADPPTGQQSPARAFEHNTFYVQGLHFGLQYVH